MKSPYTETGLANAYNQMSGERSLSGKKIGQPVKGEKPEKGRPLPTPLFVIKDNECEEDANEK